MAEAREVRVKLTADVEEYMAAMRRAKKAANWFESSTRKFLMGYLYGTLVVLAGLMVVLVGIGIYALAQ